MNLLSHVANEVKKVRVSCGAGSIAEPTLSHRPREAGAKARLMEFATLSATLKRRSPLLKQGSPTGSSTGLPQARRGYPTGLPLGNDRDDRNAMSHPR